MSVDIFKYLCTKLEKAQTEEEVNALDEQFTETIGYVKVSMKKGWEFRVMRKLEEVNAN